MASDGPGLSPKRSLRIVFSVFAKVHIDISSLIAWHGVHDGVDALEAIDTNARSFRKHVARTDVVTLAPELTDVDPVLDDARIFVGLALGAGVASYLEHQGFPFVRRGNGDPLGRRSDDGLDRLSNRSDGRGDRSHRSGTDRAGSTGGVRRRGWFVVHDRDAEDGEDDENGEAKSSRVQHGANCSTASRGKRMMNPSSSGLC